MLEAGHRVAEPPGRPTEMRQPTQILARTSRPGKNCAECVACGIQDGRSGDGLGEGRLVVRQRRDRARVRRSSHTGRANIARPSTMKGTPIHTRPATRHTTPKIRTMTPLIVAPIGSARRIQLSTALMACMLAGGPPRSPDRGSRATCLDYFRQRWSWWVIDGWFGR